MAGFLDGLADTLVPSYMAFSDRAARRADAEREFGMRKELHDAQMAEIRRRNAREDSIDSAMAGLRNVQGGISSDMQGQIQQTYGMNAKQIAAAGGAEGLRSKLASYDAPDNFDLQGGGTPTKAPAMTAAGLKVSAPKKSEVYSAMGDVALARGDLGAFGNLYGMRESATDDEVMANARMPALGTPEHAAWQQQISQRFKGHKQVTLGQPDKNGIRQMSYEDLDGNAVFAKLTPAEQETMYRAQALMDRNPTRALQMMASVDQNLASAIARDSGVTAQLGTANNAAAQHSTQLDLARKESDRKGKHDDNMLALGYAKLDMDRKEHAARLAHLRTADPKTLAELSSLSDQYFTAEDPKVRERISRQYNMTLQRAGIEMGKMPGLPQPRERADVDPKQALEFADRLGADPAHKSKPFEARYQMAHEILGGGGAGGGIGSSWGAPKGAAPAQAAPARGLPGPAQVDNGPRAQLAAATAELNRFGSVQRQRNPEGFARAKAAVEAAQAAVLAAEDKIPLGFNPSAPSFRIAAP